MWELKVWVWVRFHVNNNAGWEESRDGERERESICNCLYNN